MVSILGRGTCWLRGTAVAVLTALALSGGFHIWHHLTDADCERPVEGSTHPCSLCSALHGAALAQDSQVASAPTPILHARVYLPAPPHRIGARLHVCAPRAPPAA